MRLNKFYVVQLCLQKASQSKPIYLLFVKLLSVNKPITALQRTTVWVLINYCNHCFPSLPQEEEVQA